MAEQVFVREDGETVVLPANIYGTPRLDEGVLYVNSDDSSEVLPQLAEPCALSECNLWPRPKVLRFLEEYKTFKKTPKNRLKSNRQMFENIATVLNRHFPGRAVTGSQVENKWRILKRSNLCTRWKNNTSGHGRVICEYESELADILEKSHVANPPLLLGPGRLRRHNERSTVWEHRQRKYQAAGFRQPTCQR